MGADPFTASLLVGGAVLDMYGQYQANQAQAKAERANAAAYEEQRQMNLMASRREADIQKTQGIAFVGDQLSAFAKAGVELTGTALAQIASTKADIQREHNAILLGAQYKSRLFEMQEDQSRKTANLLSSSRYNLMQQTGIALNTAGRLSSLEKRNPGSGSDSEVVSYGNQPSLSDRGYVVTRGNLQYGRDGK